MNDDTTQSPMKQGPSEHRTKSHRIPIEKKELAAVAGWQRAGRELNLHSFAIITAWVDLLLWPLWFKIFIQMQPSHFWTFRNMCTCHFCRTLLNQSLHQTWNMFPFHLQCSWVLAGTSGHSPSHETGPLSRQRPAEPRCCRTCPGSVCASVLLVCGWYSVPHHGTKTPGPSGHRDQHLELMKETFWREANETRSDHDLHFLKELTTVRHIRILYGHCVDSIWAATCLFMFVFFPWHQLTELSTCVPCNRW